MDQGLIGQSLQPQSIASATPKTTPSPGTRTAEDVNNSYSTRDVAPLILSWSVQYPSVVASNGIPNGNHTFLLPTAVASERLPSLLQYIDRDLMQTAASHNHPLDPNALCPACHFRWKYPSLPTPVTTAHLSTFPQTAAPQYSTFLPFLPCNHWIHYRCFIWLAIRTGSDTKEKCPVCKIRLFEWEGITALTLATRTGVSMEDRPAFNQIIGTCLPSDSSIYETACAAIEKQIESEFFAQLALPLRYADGSPDVLRALNSVVEELGKERQNARWLTWSTRTGELLFKMLVAIKMRRFLVHTHAKIMSTAAWKAFEDGGEQLRG